jgi:hypothetical protein
MKKIYVLLILACVWLSSHSYSVPANFYTSARPMGMGGAFTAVDKGISGIMYNPACRIEESASNPTNREMLISGGILGSNNNENAFFNGIYNVDNGRFREKDIKEQNSYSEAGLVFSRKIIDTLSIGLSVQNRTNSISFEGSSGSISANTIDLGILYHITDSLSVGIVETNAYTINAASSSAIRNEKVAVNPGGYIGLAYDPSGGHSLLTFDMGASDIISGNPGYKMGYEWQYDDNIKLRVGEALFTDKETKGISCFGIGFGQNLDYAAQAQEGELTQFISFHVDPELLGKPKDTDIK